MSTKDRQVSGLVDTGSGLDWSTCAEARDVAHVREGDAEKMSDQELLDIMAEAGVECSRADFDKVVPACDGSTEVCGMLVEASGVEVSGYDEDDLMYCVTELCQRWYPDWVSVDSLDALMQEGYDAFGQYTARELLPALALWERAWEQAKALRRKWDVRTVAAFDDRFMGYQSLHNWAQDYETELLNVSFHHLGDQRVHDDFVRDFAREFPTDVQGVLGFFVDDEGTLVQVVFDEDGDWPFDEPWEEDASEFDWISSADPDPALMPTPSSETKRQPIRVQKVGRNDPCPCGSGKKYKKCCGRF